MDKDGIAMDETAEHAMDHVVLVIFENRSFDSLLGHLYTPEEKPDFEGVIGKELKNPVPAWAPPVPATPRRGRSRVTSTTGRRPNLDDPDPGPRRGVPAHQHPALQHPGPGTNRGQAGPQDDLLPMRRRPDQVPTMDGFVTDYISNCEALRHEPPEFERVPPDHAGPHPGPGAGAQRPGPGFRGVRPLVQRGAVPDLPQPIVLDRGHLIGARRQRSGQAVLLRQQCRDDLRPSGARRPDLEGLRAGALPDLDDRRHPHVPSEGTLPRPVRALRAIRTSMSRQGTLPGLLPDRAQPPGRPCRLPPPVR